MFWVPVIFACVVSGDCMFIYDKPEVSEKTCQKVVADMIQQASKHPEITASKGTCIPVKNGKQI